MRGPAFQPPRRVARLGGCLLPFCLQAQGLPPLPVEQPPEVLRPLEYLLPVRPIGVEVPPGRRLPFTYRGERVRQSWTGDRVLDRADAWVLEQGAIEGRGALLVADVIRFNPATQDLEAEGNIRLEYAEEGIRLRCGRLRMNWAKEEGEAFLLQLELPPEWTLRSQRVTFQGRRYWAFEDVEVSGCPEREPGWSMRIRDLKVDLQGYATLRHAWLWMGRVPTPYFLPWAIYPAREERTPGLLLPQPGRSSHLGFSLALPYFQPLGKWADVTLTPEAYQKAGVLWGAEVRWQPDPTHVGSFTGQYIHQRQLSDLLEKGDRYRYAFREFWQREDGWQFSADLNHASDALLDMDYGRGIGSLGTNAFDSSMYLGKNYARASVSLSAGSQRTFFQAADPLFQADFPASFRRQALPSLQVRAYPFPLGELYLDGGMRISRLGYETLLGNDTRSGRYQWGREDAFTRLQGRLGQWGPLRADLQLMGRLTHYGASLQDPFFSVEGGETGFANSALSPFEVVGPSLQRVMGGARLKLAAPQVGRVFEHFELFGRTGEVKHVLEPFLAFTANSRFGDAGLVPRFDEVDSRPGVDGSAMGEQSIELGLRQHLFGRPAKGVPFSDLVRWRASIKYHVQPILLGDGRTQRKGWGSVDNDMDVEPDDRVRLSFRRSSEVGDSGTDNAISADVKVGEAGRYNLAFFSTGINRFLVRQRGIQVGGIQRFWEDRVRLEFQANYDFRLRTFATSQVGLAWMRPCVAWTLKYTHVMLQIPGVKGREDRLDLGVTLRGLGDLFKFGL